MSCFTKNSLQLLTKSVVDAITAAGKLKTNAEKMKQQAITFKDSDALPVLSTGLYSDISNQWLILGEDKALKGLFRLLACYQVPYAGAWQLNVLASGFLVFCHDAIKASIDSAFPALTGATDKQQILTLELAKALQQSFPYNDLRETSIYIRPQYFGKYDRKIKGDDADDLFKQSYAIYKPMLSKALTEVGFEFTAVEIDDSEIDTDTDEGYAASLEREAQQVANSEGPKAAYECFAYSTEGGMTEREAFCTLYAIDVADDMLNLTQQWYHFSKDKFTQAKDSVLSKNPDVQQAVAQVFVKIFEQQGIDQIGADFSGTETGFFSDKFDLSLLKTIHNQYKEGSPVQLRLFCDDTREVTVTAGDSATKGPAGTSSDRECQYTPLTSGSPYVDKADISVGNPIEPVPTSRRRKNVINQKAYEEKLAHTGSRAETQQASFFTRVSAHGKHLKRMVVRIRLDTCISGAVEDKDVGDDVFFNNIYQLADTIVHELLHTWYAMVDFYYADMRSQMMVNEQQGMNFNGLTLAKKQPEKDSKAFIEGSNTTYYPRDVKFDLSHYTWQINNVDNYMIAFHKIYMLDDTLFKHKHPIRNREKEKLALAKCRFAYLSKAKKEGKIYTSDGPDHKGLEETFWRYSGADVSKIIATTTAKSTFASMLTFGRMPDEVKKDRV